MSHSRVVFDKLVIMLECKENLNVFDCNGGWDRGRSLETPRAEMTNIRTTFAWPELAHLLLLAEMVEWNADSATQGGRAVLSLPNYIPVSETSLGFSLSGCKST